MALTRQEKLDAQAVFAAGDACTDCGGIHSRACPRIKRRAFHPNGNVIEVEYWRKWDQTGVIFPDDAYDPDDGAANGS